MDIDGEVQANLSLLGNASSHFSVEHRRAVIKHLNKDLRPLADAEFPNRGPQLFGDDFGKRENNVSALKGLQVKKSYRRFSGSGDFKISPSPRSCRAVHLHHLTGSQCSDAWTQLRKVSHLHF